MPGRLEPNAEFPFRNHTFAEVLDSPRFSHANCDTLSILFEFVIPFWIDHPPLINNMEQIVLERRRVPARIRLIVIHKRNVCYLFTSLPHNNPGASWLFC